MRKKTRQQKQATSKPSKRKTDPKQASFLQHVLELRRRVFIIVGSVVTFSGIAFYFENQIITALLKPANGERFIYTSPGGGIDFLIKVCVYTGIVLSAPIIIYQILRFIEPLMAKNSSRFIFISSAVAGLLALTGVAFGYYLGLPVALNFLLDQFQVSDITALITISSYLSFVIAYLAGASLIFQMPLWMYLINRITPLKPRALLKHQRWVILISFIVAAIINPSPRPQDLFLLAVPIIASYEIGVIIVWKTNRISKKAAVAASLTERDRKIQAEREARLQALSYPLEHPMKATAEAINASEPVSTRRPVKAPQRSKRYVNDVVGPKRVKY